MDRVKNFVSNSANSEQFPTAGPACAY